MRKITFTVLVFLVSLISVGQICTPISTLDCNQIEQTLPVTLDFTVDNGNLSESGFTMVQEPSSRLSLDDAIADPNVPGYAPTLLSRDASGLLLTSTKGIFHSQPVGSPQSSETNSQMNALGIGVTSPNQTFDISSTFINPDFSISSGNLFQQGGIWFGLDEDHYVKLCVTKTGTNTKKVQLLVENMDNTTSSTAFLEKDTTDIGAATEITLRLELDPVANTVKGFYTLDGGSEILISDIDGDFLPVPVNYFSGISYNSINPSDILSFAGIYTSQRRASNSDPINILFKDFEVDIVPIPKILSFDQSSIDFTVVEGESAIPKTITVSSTYGNPTFTLSDDPDSSNWLILPQGTTPISGGFAFLPGDDIELGVVGNLPVGTYSTTLFAIDQPDDGYDNASISINLEVVDPATAVDVKINFSNSGTSPEGYLSDTGIEYGAKGNGFTYGWLDANDGTTPINLSNTARNRNISGASVIQNTLLHMQFDDVRSSGNEGIWEIEVPNGNYNISLGAGDFGVDGASTTPSHTINVEGVNLVSNFVPIGGLGDPARVTTALGTVQVSDGKLTVDAFGGFNTKINYIEIASAVGIQTPSIVGFIPSNGSVDVPVDSQIITSNLFLPNIDTNGTTGVDVTTVNNQTVKLFKQNTPSNEEISISVNALANSIEIIPNAGLEFNTTYIVDINGVLDTVGATFEAFTMAFTTEDGIISFDPVKINFSRANDAPPAGFIVDSGLPYGIRSNNLAFGWLKADDNTALDLSSRARNRNITGFSTQQNTLIHMQYQHVNSSGVEGKWEIEVPDGIYEVIVSVGDPNTDSATTSPIHQVNAEGITVLTHIPVGIAADPGQFSSGSASVTVIDGKLTLDATGGFNTKINFVEIERVGEVNEPFFPSITPEDSATDVSINDFQITAGIFTPSGYELSTSTLAGNVNLYEIVNGQEVLVPSNSNDTGGGDAITLTPIDDLKEFTTYIFRLTSGIEANLIGDVNTTIPFIPFESSFTTGVLNSGPPPLRDLSGVSFTKVAGEGVLGNGVDNQRFSSLVIGPDYKLYGTTIGDFASDGQIYRWDIEPDGTLSNLEILSPALDGSPHPVTGEPGFPNRLIIGLEFDPASTPENVIAYITHSAATITNGPEWDGKLTRLSGPTFSNVEDVLIHLPRSAKDHLPNSLIKDDNGDLYLSVGSNSAGGEIDDAWANRPERLLTAAVLKIELDKLPSTLPLSVFTTDDISVINNAPLNSITMSDGTYNPYASNSPITIFSTGVRNAYDMVWHSNGWMYVPTNGTAGNGTSSPNAPSTANYPLARRIDGLTSIPVAPALNGGETQKDWLFKTQGGSYHGHPNPYRGEFVLNHGGKPYSNIPGQSQQSDRDVSKYPITIGPDVNYLEPAYDFGFNKSPNGAIEYRSDAFGGKLQGLLMVTRFSGQDDVLVLDPLGNSGDISEVYNSIPGLDGFDDPLDIIEDPRTGNLYVSEYDRTSDGVARITLLRADVQATKPDIASLPKELIFEITTNNDGVNSQSKNFDIVNNGQKPLDITSVSLAGTFADQFTITPTTGVTGLETGQVVTYTIQYAPTLDSNNLGFQDAKIVFESNDTTKPTFEVGIFGLKKSGFSGNNEPPLQDVVNTLGIGINVGWTNLSNGTSPALLGDEIEVEQWVKADPELPVNITAVARYSPAEELPFGWYTNYDTIVINEVGVLGDDIENAQTLYPPLDSGLTSFEPLGNVFGIYVDSQSFNRINYTEDAINTGGVAHRTRVYPMKDREGNPIDNSYLITFEDATNGDYQDYMFVIDNAIPFEGGFLSLSFNEEELEYDLLLDQSVVPTQSINLVANGGVSPQGVTLIASENWVVLPSTFDFNTNFEVGINNQNLTVGTYHATIQASAENYETAILDVYLTITPEYTYKFNFLPQNSVGISPAGFIEDTGTPYGLQATSEGDLTFGWVEPNTVTPGDSSINTRDRNNGDSSDDPLLNTFNTIGNKNFTINPTYDWLLNIPNGKYYVNISVGDPNFSDSNHLLDINNTTVIDFDQENNNPENLSNAENLEIIEVYDGILRLSLATGGVNAKINYLQLAPVDESSLPPSIVADFDGLKNGNNTYRGNTTISLEAINNSDSTGITSFQYQLDGSTFEDYTAPIVVFSIGNHKLTATAIDANGNSFTKDYLFTIEDTSGGILEIENMTKIPGTQRGFPADDYYTFHRLDQTFGEADVHDSNVMRLNNVGTSDLVISEINISDTNDFTYQLLSDSGSVLTLPTTISANSYADVVINFIASPNDPDVRKALYKEEIEIVSDADNAFDKKATIHGAYMIKPNDNEELNTQEIFEAFGFQSSMLSLVNDQGTIQPLNPIPYLIGTEHPTASDVDNGYSGDLILSASFVQADPSKPVRGIQLAAFHGGPSSNGAGFIQQNSNSTVGGMSFAHGPSWFNTLLPKNSSGTQISNDSATTINEPFRIRAVSFNTGGYFNNIGVRQLGARVYKVIDHHGNLIPNEYIVIQDFAGNGIRPGFDNGAGGGDFNDNVFYFTNIKPVNSPSAPSQSQKSVLEEEVFVLNFNQFFNNGYPGNKLTYSVTYNGGALPNWMQLKLDGSGIIGVPPTGTLGNTYSLNLVATDSNGIVVNSTININVVNEIINDLPWIEDFEGIPNGTTSDNGDTGWTSSRAEGDFSVSNGRFTITNARNTGTWTSEVISIEGADSVSISIDVDDSDNTKEFSDFVRAYYSLNGGSLIQFGEVRGNINAQTFNASDITGTTIQIIIESSVSFTNEFYHIDNISVTEPSNSSNFKTNLYNVDSGLNYVSYPNPATDKFIIEYFDVEEEIKEILIFDITGKKVAFYDPKTIKSGNKYILDVTNLKEGVYFVNIYNKEKQLENLRIVIKK